MISIEFERVYLAKAGETDVDLIFGDWTYNDVHELEDHVAELKGEGVEIVRNRMGRVTLIRFLTSPEQAF